MNISENHRKMLKIVTMYYEKGLTQAAIAKKVGVSRPVISKILQQAKEKGIVSISIKDPNAYTVELALKIEDKYQLEEVIVVANNNYRLSSETSKQLIGQAAAIYLKKQLKPTLRIGLSWGTTLADMIEEMPFQSIPSITVCPLVGGVSNEHLSFDTNHLVFRLAEKLNSNCQYFYAPALAESNELADSLKQSQLVSGAIQEASQVDFAIIGVGNPNEQSTWERFGYMTNEEIKKLEPIGIAGDAVASLFDKNGKTVDNELTRRMLGIKVEDLLHIPKVMIVGSGKEKAESIKPLLIAKYCNILVIDQLLAEQLVD